MTQQAHVHASGHQQLAVADQGRAAPHVRVQPLQFEAGQLVGGLRQGQGAAQQRRGHCAPGGGRYAHDRTESYRSSHGERQVLRLNVLILLCLGVLASCRPSEPEGVAPAAASPVSLQRRSAAATDPIYHTLTWTGGGPEASDTTCLSCGADSIGYVCPNNQTSAHWTKNIDLTVPPGLLVVGIEAQVYGASVRTTTTTRTTVVGVKLNSQSLTINGGSATTYNSTNRSCSASGSVCDSVKVLSKTSSAGIGWRTDGTPNQLIFTPDDQYYCLSHVKLKLTVAERTIEASPSPLEFGNQKRGVPSAVREVGITNNGGAPLTVSALTTTHPAFTVVGPTIPSGGLIVNANGGSQIIQVQFTPDALTSFAGKLNITSNAANATTEVSLSGTGVNFATDVSPESINFDDVRVGTEPTQTVTVRNTGTGAITLDAFAMSGDSAFTLVSPTSGPVSVAGNGGQTTLTVKFKPLTAMATSVSGVLGFDIAGDAFKTSATVNLSGRGVKPNLEFDPAGPYDFGNVRVNSEPTQVVTIRNTGGLPITINSVTLTGNSAFTIVTKPSGAFTLAANGGQEQVTVKFKPTTVMSASVSGTLTFASGDSEFPSTPYTLSGRGAKPNLVFDPAGPYDFGNVRVNSEPTQAVIIRNTGGIPITIDSVALTGNSAFTIVTKPSGAFTLAANGGQEQVTVKFKPTTVMSASVSGTLTFASGDSEFPSTPYTLSGRGATPNLVLSPTGPYDFGNVRVNAEPTQAVTIRNNGGFPITIDSVALTGNPAFTIVTKPSGAFTLAANGGQEQVTVKFKPTAPMTSSVTSTLTFASGDSEFSSTTYTLSGKGVRPNLEFDPASPFDFGNVRVSTEPTQVVTIRNTGGLAITINSVALAGNSAFTIVTKPSGAFTLAADGGQQQVTVKFKPTAVMSASVTGTLTFASGDSEFPSTPYTLRGRGVNPNLVFEPAGGYDFGNVRVNAEPTQLVTIRNDGSSDITIDSVTLSGDSSFSIVTKPSGAFTLAANGGQEQVTVKFKPTALMSASVTGTLNFNSADTAFASTPYSLRGRGVKPNIVFAPVGGLDIGETYVGSDVTTGTVTVRNTGTGPITFSRISIEGDSAFTLVSPPATPYTLSPGDLPLRVKFKPLSEMPAAVSATIKLTSADPDFLESQVQVSGRGVRPAVEVAPTSHAFGSQPVGSVSASASLKVSNLGSGTLRITSVRVSGPFALDSTDPFNLTDNDRERTLAVTFRPTAQGPVAGSVTFDTNDPLNSTVTVNLSGNGETSLGVSPTSFDFGNVRVGGTPGELQVTFTNETPVAITLQRVSFSSDSQFSVEGLSSPVVLNPGSPGYPLKVKFTPSRTGDANGIITIESSATNNSHTLTLLGRGTEAKVQISLPSHPGQTALDFEDVEVKSTKQELVRLTNIGGAPLDLTSARVVTKLADGGTAVSSAPFEYRGPSTLVDIAPDGGYVEFPVAFSPTENADSSATLVINSNAVNNPVELPLIGKGVAAQLRLSSSALAFGNQRVGIPSGAQRVFITNDGKADLKVQGLVFTRDFSISSSMSLPSPESPLVVPKGGGTRALDVIFTPSDRILVEGSLTILSNAINVSDASDGGDKGPQLTLSGTGIDGLSNVSPTDINFGGTEVGSSSVKVAVRVRNGGDAPLTLQSAAIENSTEENPFIITGFNTGMTLRPGSVDVHEFFVAFRPLVNGYQSANLVIQTDSALNPKYNLTVTGTGEGAEVELLRPSVTFNKTNVGGVNSQSLSIRNKGVRTLQIYDISFDRKTVLDGGTAGTDDMASDFSVGRSADGGTLFTLSVDAGDVVPVELKFSPTAVGLREARAVITSNAKTVRFDVSGEGTSPVLVVDPPVLNIEGVLLGSSSTAQIRITNEGNGSVSIDNITLSQTGETFRLTHSALPIPLAPKASETLFVTFSPTEAQPLASAQLLAVPSSTSVPRVLVPIVGVGVRDPVSVESELDFGQQLVDNTSLPRTLHISNNTDSRISLTGVTVVGTDAAQFTPATLPTSVELVRGTPFPLNVTFRPRAQADVNSVLKLFFAQLSSPIEVPLRGKGIPKVISINPSPLDFGGVRAGTGMREEPITLMNLSSDPITLLRPEVIYSNGEPFLFDWASLEGLVLNPGEPVIKKVKYQPTVESTSETELYFGTSSPLKPRAVVFKMQGKATRRILSADVASLDFGRVDAKAPAQTKTVTITNKSPQPQNVVVTMKALDDSPFVLETSGLTGSIPPEGSATFTVTFDPDKAGEVEDEVQVRLQDIAEPEVQISVKGIGRILTGSGGGCACGSTEAGSAGMLMLLALVGLGSRRRKRE
ncbi:choice-of-anchor D domain-containing protein [Archangium gephyra]|nr:choice-of-anchor D domain-containing protein [Archangium gephyra]